MKFQQKGLFQIIFQILTYYQKAFTCINDGSRNAYLPFVQTNNMYSMHWILSCIK